MSVVDVSKASAVVSMTFFKQAEHSSGICFLLRLIKREGNRQDQNTWTRKNKGTIVLK